MLFLTHFKVFDEKRSDAATFFASKDYDMKVNEADYGPSFKLHGRWHGGGYASECNVREASDAKTLAA
jgi:hypothetical protein